jgi:hypothetical protein
MRADQFSFVESVRNIMDDVPKASLDHPTEANLDKI